MIYRTHQNSTLDKINLGYSKLWNQSERLVKLLRSCSHKQIEKNKNFDSRKVEIVRHLQDAEYNVCMHNYSFVQVFSCSNKRDFKNANGKQL